MTLYFLQLILYALPAQKWMCQLSGNLGNAKPVTRVLLLIQDFAEEVCPFRLANNVYITTDLFNFLFNIYLIINIMIAGCDINILYH